MNKQDLHKEIIQNLIYPRKLPFTLILSELSVNEFMLMASFLAYEKECGNHITVNELASRMEVTVPAVSRALRKLEDRALVKRVPCKECRRNTFVKISPKGRELFELNREAAEFIVDKLINALTVQEIEEAIEFNKKVASIVDETCKLLLAKNEQNNVEELSERGII